MSLGQVALHVEPSFKQTLFGAHLNKRFQAFLTC